MSSGRSARSPGQASAPVTLLALFVALWELVGLQTTVLSTSGPVHFTDLYGSERHAAAALECRPGGKPVLYLSPSADIETIVHEFAHAYDCLDDGSMNASPMGGSRPAERPAWTSDYCWNTDAEWYACSAVRARMVRPVVPGRSSLDSGTRPMPLTPVTPLRGDD